jgi:hypothetical protein
MLTKIAFVVAVIANQARFLISLEKEVQARLFVRINRFNIVNI